MSLLSYTAINDDILNLGNGQLSYLMRHTHHNTGMLDALYALVRLQCINLDMGVGMTPPAIHPSKMVQMIYAYINGTISSER